MTMLIALGAACFFCTGTAVALTPLAYDLAKDDLHLAAFTFGAVAVANYATGMLCAFAFGWLL
jgi:hypothetical protein